MQISRSEFGRGETTAMRYYLVPQNKLRLVESRRTAAEIVQRKDWTKLLQSFHGSKEIETAKAYASILQGMRSVSLRSGLLLLNEDMKTAVPAQQLIRILIGSDSMSHVAEAFLRRIRETETAVPEANTREL